MRFRKGAVTKEYTVTAVFLCHRKLLKNKRSYDTKTHVEKGNTMIKLIATDIDGTLVIDGSGELNPEYFPVIRHLMNQGIVFAVATGRSRSSIENILGPVVNDIVMIAEGGSYVSFQGETIELHVIQEEMVKELIHDIRTMTNCEILINAPHCCYSDTKDQEFLRWMIEDYHFNVVQVDDVLEVDDAIIKVSLYHPKDAAQEAKKGFWDKWKDKVHISIAGNEWVDCIQNGTNKGVALSNLQKKHGITKEETMVFGDNINDLEMLEQATYSFAIGNARQEVKEKANYIADTNVNHGVLQVLKQVLDTYEGK